MSMLFTFASLTICCTAAAAILPEGAIKRTALLVMGLTVMVMWLETLRAQWPELPLPSPVTSLLETAAGADLDGAQAAFAQRLAQTQR